MTSRFLPIIKANAQYDIDGTLPLVLNGNVPLSRVLVLCRNYRRRGIVSFFVEGLPRLLHVDLQRSGGAFLNSLKGAADNDKATSKVSAHSRREWNAQEEYEDDFLYVFFLMQEFFPVERERNVDALIERYTAVVDGAPDARLDVCKAFEEKDEDLFDQALQQLLMQHESYYRNGALKGSVLEEDWATEGQLCVEGLALLRLAEIQGFSIQNDYLGVPSAARQSVHVAYSTDAWKSP